MISAKLNLTIDKEPVSCDISVPAGQCGAEAILSFVRKLSDRSIQIAVNRNLKPGQAISCSKGCGECCAQLVPVTEIEIQEIAKFINALPKSRRKSIMQAFTKAKETFENAGMWEQILQPQQIDLADSVTFSLRYFEQGVYCPFLEDGACSIHSVRPLACREYLVTSDPEFCANPGDGKIDGIDIPVRISAALGILLEDDEQHVSSWVPLIAAPFWNKKYTRMTKKNKGPAWAELFLEKLEKVS